MFWRQLVITTPGPNYSPFLKVMIFNIIYKKSSYFHQWKVNTELPTFRLAGCNWGTSHWESGREYMTVCYTTTRSKDRYLQGIALPIYCVFRPLIIFLTPVEVELVSRTSVRQASSRHMYSRRCGASDFEIIIQR